MDSGYRIQEYRGRVGGEMIYFWKVYLPCIRVTV